MLHELYVHRYKNLRRVRLALDERTVLFGRNGVGKTNLIEALALAAGDPITLAQIARRASVPDPGDIQLVVAVRPGELDRMGERSADAPAARLFWAGLGLDERPTSWAAGMAAAPLPDDVRAALTDLDHLAIRYSLRSISGIEQLARHDRGRSARGDDDQPERSEITRSFDRTLCVPREVANGLQAFPASHLPEPLRPLHAIPDTAPDGGGWCGAVTLPPVPSCPVIVSWLARERTDDEIWSDYEEVIETAAGTIRNLTDQAARSLKVLDWPDEMVDDSRFIARTWFSAHAQAAIASLLPELRLSADDDWLTVEVDDDRSRLHRIGGPGDLAWITQLSSGERALVDEALLDADAALRDGVMDALATLSLLLTEPDLPLDVQVELGDKLDAPTEGWWSRSDAEHLVAWGRRTFHERYGQPLRLHAVRVRAFDEPERHLHPRAQADLAFALHERATADTVVIASHAGAFLARDGWQHHHLYRSPEGTVVDTFTPTDLDNVHRVAVDMGLSAGDLLGRYRYCVLVEGVHDEAFLDGHYGDVLRSLGVLVLPMHGAHEVLQAAELHLVVRYLDVGVGVMLDHSRARDGSPRRSKESELFGELRKAARRRGRTIDELRLRRPDIIAYLADDVVRRRSPGFPGFARVEQRWERQKGRDYKAVAAELAPGVRFTRDTIREMARETAELITPPADLAEVMATIGDATRRPR